MMVPLPSPRTEWYRIANWTGDAVLILEKYNRKDPAPPSPETPTFFPAPSFPVWPFSQRRNRRFHLIMPLPRAAPPRKSAAQAYEDAQEERKLRLHRARIENTKSCIDCHLPDACRYSRPARGPAHNSERIYAIEHENHLLVQRMTRIMNEDSCIDNKCPWSGQRNTTYAQRMRDLEHQRIEKENRQILARIEQSKSSYPLEKLQRDNRRHEIIASRIGRFQRQPPQEPRSRYTIHFCLASIHTTTTTTNMHRLYRYFTCGWEGLGWYRGWPEAPLWTAKEISGCRPRPSARQLLVLLSVMGWSPYHVPRAGKEKWRAGQSIETVRLRYREEEAQTGAVDRQGARLIPIGKERIETSTENQVISPPPCKKEENNELLLCEGALHMASSGVDLFLYPALSAETVVSLPFLFSVVVICIGCSLALRPEVAWKFNILIFLEAPFAVLLTGGISSPRYPHPLHRVIYLLSCVAICCDPLSCSSCYYCYAATSNTTIASREAASEHTQLTPINKQKKKKETPIKNCTSLLLPPRRTSCVWFTMALQRQQRAASCSPLLVMYLCVVLLAAVSPAMAATVNVLDLVSMTDTPRAVNFMKGLKAALKEKGDKTNAGYDIVLKSPSNPDSLVESITAEAADNTVPMAVGPATDAGLLSLMESSVTTTDHFSYLSPLTSSDLGLDYTPNVYFMLNVPLVQLMLMIQHAKATWSTNSVGVMYVERASDVSEKIELGPAEINLIRSHISKKVHTYVAPSTATTVDDEQFAAFVAQSPDVIFIFDRLGSSPVSVDFFSRLVSDENTILRKTPVYAPAASAIAFTTAYQEKAAARASVLDPYRVFFTTSIPVLLDSQYTFLEDFAKCMTASGITADNTGTAENVALIEGWAAGKVLLDMLNANYYDGVTREEFLAGNWNQNRYLLGNDFAIGPYFGECTELMEEQAFTCSSSQGARTVFLNHLVASSTASGKDTLTPQPRGEGEGNWVLGFPPGTPINGDTVWGGRWPGGTGDSSSSSSSGLPWWAILLIVLGVLLLLLLLLLLLWYLCCGCCCPACCAGCCAGGAAGAAVTDASLPLTATVLSIQHGDALYANAPKEMEKAVRSYQKMTRELIKEYECYEARMTKGGDCMIISSSPDAAVKLSHHLQTRLLEHKWNSPEMERLYRELDRREKRGEKWSPHDLPLLSPSLTPSSEGSEGVYQGPRVGMGIHTGYVDSIEYNKEDEVYVYEGHTIVMAEQAQTYTHGSRILVSQYTYDSLTHETRHEYDYIRTNYQVETEDHKLIPLYVLRTPITNAEDMAAGRPPTALSRTVEPEPHRHVRAISATEVEKKKKKEKQAKEKSQRVAVTKTGSAVVTLIRSVEEEPHIPRDSSSSEPQNNAHRDPSPPHPHTSTSKWKPRDRPPVLTATEVQEHEAITPRPPPAYRRDTLSPEAAPPARDAAAAQAPPPTHIRAMSEEPSKSKSSPPVNNDPYYRYRHPGHNDAAVQTHLSSIQEEPEPRFTPRDSAREMKASPRATEPPIRLRKYEGEVVIHPLQTVRVLRGTVNGYSIAYAARLAHYED
eukprot:gene3635-2570_t